MSDDQASTARAMLREMLDRLEQAYGKVKFLPKEPPLDQAVFLIFRESWDYKKAARALRVLQGEFVDWNEVRVSSAGEMTNLLRFLADHHMADKIDKVLSLLERVYRDRSQVSLDFLYERELDQRQDYLTSLDLLSSSDIQLMLQLLAPPEELLMTYQALRVGSRAGLIAKTTSIPGGTRAYREILEIGDWPRFQAMMVHHGDEICQSRHFRCDECRVNDMCKGSRAGQEAAGQAGKAS